MGRSPLQALDDLLGHLLAADGRDAGRADDVRRADAVLQHLVDGLLDAVRFVHHVEGVAQHHGGGEHGGDGVGLVLAGDVRRGAMDGFIQAASGFTEGSAGQESDGAGDLAGFIREYIAEHIAGDHHIKA